MSLNVVSLFARAPRPRSWSNQELAEFYRVQGSLARAGLEVETDQGLSDEGDPWFVFCRVDSGDVIIHFARIDGLYVVASPAFGSCVQGLDFRALIEGLMEQHPIVVPREKERGKFFIHPAALLVALVTTAFFKLYQGDALAADGRDDGHGPLLAASNTRAPGATQSHVLALDERAAATLMVAVAVAVAWEQVTNPEDQTQVAQLALDDHSALLPHSAVPVAATLHASSQDPAMGDARETAAADPGASIVHDSPAIIASPVQTVPQGNADPSSPSVRVADEQQRISAPDAPPAFGSGDNGSLPAVPNRMADAAPDHSGQPPAPTEQHVTAEASASSGSAPAAMVEVRAIVGELLQTHLAANAEAPQQQFVLSLVNVNQGIPHDGTVPTIGTDLAAAPSEADSSGTPGKTAPAFSATPVAQAPSPVDQAIHEFIVDHADFQIIKLDHEVIMYDPALTPSNSQYAQQENFTFSDGSSLLLIGLPQHNPEAAFLV